MKKIILATAFMAALCTLRAQVFYGTTSEANNGTGTICKLVTGDSSKLTSAFTFDYSNGEYPLYLKLLQASDGKLYGMTYRGGTDNRGVIFSFDPATSTYKKLKDFNSTDGTNPAGSLIQASDGKLYGMTVAGGTADKGVIFSFDPVTLFYTKKKDFDNTDGANPYGSLMQASNGKLYGMTSEGGTHNNGGVLFSFNPATSAYIKIKDLDTSTGRDPYGSLIQASNGKLYGMTSAGGNDRVGAIFSFDLSTSIFTKLKDFNLSDGTFPYGSLMQASNGKLYGMTSDGYNGYGSIFSFDPVTLKYIREVGFNYRPYGSLIQASNSRLYGLTSAGGKNYDGAIFSFNPITSKFIVVKDLSGVDGTNPYGSLIQASNGKLYGVTSSVTPEDFTGVVFSYNIQDSVYTILKYLGVNTNGSDMSGGLAKNSGKKLYGMTKNGGAYGQGTIFSYDATGGFFKKLWDMEYINGSHPEGKLLLASDGKLYGTTSTGGKHGYGVLFSFDPSDSIYTKLLNFYWHTIGANPSGYLAEAADGKLYGTTTEGGVYEGSYSYGNIFSFDPVTLKHTILMGFDRTNGMDPTGSLVQAANGKLYGTTINGGGNEGGVVFTFDPVTLKYTKLKDFAGAEGRHPYGLIQASNGKLYGMTSEGGSNNFGVIFSFNPSNSKYTKLKDFKNSDGAFPYGGLEQGSNGKLYGMTSKGGKKGLGAAFSYDISSSTYTKLADFNGANGSIPMYTSFVEVPCKKYYRDADGDGYGNVNITAQLCEPQAGYVADSTDCKDNDKTIYPKAPELCDGKDNDCDGVADEGCPITVSIADTAIAEGNNGKKQMVFTVKLNKTSQKQVSVQYTTLNTTATGGSDYVKRSDTVFFAPGTKSNTIAISIIGDTIAEPDETFRIKLSNPVNAGVGDSIAVGTILNDDGANFANTTNNNAIASIITGKYISLAPNPATDKVNVVLTGFSGNIVIRLSNITGKSLQEKKVRLSSAKQMIQGVDVSNYVSGIYIITVFDEQGNSKTQKLVIEH